MEEKLEEEMELQQEEEMELQQEEEMGEMHKQTPHRTNNPGEDVVDINIKNEEDVLVVS